MNPPSLFSPRDGSSYVFIGIRDLFRMFPELPPSFKVGFIITVFIITVILIYLTYITIKTFVMKKNTAEMGVIVGKEGDIEEVDETGKKGWILIHGESWRFESDEPLKKGDFALVVSHKRMILKVKFKEKS